nr:Chain C, Helicon FP06652 [synthetic construct]7UYJ_D Chain D, Helicon FP06652 [synthetic construct]
DPAIVQCAWAALYCDMQ